MKHNKYLAVMAGLVMFTGLLSRGEEFGGTSELKLSGVFVSPAKEQWDNGVGGELSYTMWMTPQFGLSFAVGAQQWKTAKDGQSASLNSSTSVEGSAAFYPVGVSAAVRIPLARSMQLTLEGGFRYVVADSDVTENFSSTQMDQFGSSGVSAQGESKVTLDNAVIGKVAAGFNFKVGEEATLSIGAGYDFDISEGDAHAFGHNLGTYSLDAFFIQAGLAIRI